MTGSGRAPKLAGCLDDSVVDHYAHHFAMEVAASERAVTDWERRRYFEQI